MRLPFPCGSCLAASAALLALASCHEPFSHSDGGARYTIGGTVSGLPAGASVALAADGTSGLLSANGSFTLAGTAANGDRYAVTVTQQPAGAQCVVGNATGTIGAADVTDITVTCTPTLVDAWTWIAGSGTAVGVPGVYGTLGVPASLNAPGARSYARGWTDAGGNLWLFGGSGFDATGVLASYLGDLWQFNRSTRQWTWKAGAPQADAAGVYGTQGAAAAGNGPGARAHAMAWTDLQANLWLFGGYGHDAAGVLGYLDDLWQFTPATGLWTWVGGGSHAGATAGQYGTRGFTAATNQPGARVDAATWTDAQGNLWLFGGNGYDATGSLVALNDLWEYSPGAGWKWVGGASVGGAVAGVYGAQGQGTTANSPGARLGAAGWRDGAGTLWLFGGYGYDATATLGELNDLWQYSVAANSWTWVAGSSASGAIAGTYGSKGSAGAGNAPGARRDAVTWTDASGNLWLLGGAGYDAAGASSLLNDLWLFNPATGLWTWIDGSNLGGAIAGSYGTLGVAAAGNTPGARQGATAWRDPAGSLWLFGGTGYAGTGALAGALNDLWEFTP